MDDLIRRANDSEYNNIAGLMGLDDSLMGSLNDELEGLGLADKMKFLNKISARSTASRGSRAEFEKFFKEVPDSVKASILSGDLRLADYTIYSVKQIKSKTVKLFETQDVKESGITNISNARLQKNFVFLVSGIYLLAGIASDPNDKEKIKAIDFKSVSTMPAVANAEFSLKSNKKQIIPEGSIVRKFVTDNNQIGNLGYYKLDNPRLIKDDELIEFVVELGTMTNLDPSAFLYVGLDGTGTTP